MGRPVPAPVERRLDGHEGPSLRPEGPGPRGLEPAPVTVAPLHEEVGAQEGPDGHEEGQTVNTLRRVAATSAPRGRGGRLADCSASELRPVRGRGPPDLVRLVTPGFPEQPVPLTDG